MKFFIYFSLLTLGNLAFAISNACINVDQLPLDELKRFDFNCFEEKAQEERVMGWASTKGGRSWTQNDLKGFHAFLDKLAINKDGNIELIKWGIPVDCFDALIVLHALYAYKHGLYVHYSKYNNSIAYANKPKIFFKRIIEYGTANADLLTYEADLWDLRNHSTGLISIYPGNPGHAYFLTNFDSLVPKKLEGPYPAARIPIRRGYDFEIRNLTTIWNAKKTYSGGLRRFYIYNRNKPGQFIVPSNHPKASPLGTNALWWTCVSDQKHPDKRVKSLWQNMKNFRYYYSTTKQSPDLSCKHNNPTDLKPAFTAEYPQISFLLAQEAQRYIRDRIYKVNSGYKQCYLKFAGSETCTEKGHGTYSTPGYDKGLKKYISSINGMFSSGYIQNKQKEKVLYNELANYITPAFNFHQYLFDHERLDLQVRLFQKIDDELKYNQPLDNVMNPYIINSSDPKESLEARWGCYGEGLESCLR